MEYVSQRSAGLNGSIRGDEVSSDELQDVGVCQRRIVEPGGINQDNLLSAHVEEDRLLYFIGATFQAGTFSEVGTRGQVDELGSGRKWTELIEEEQGANRRLSTASGTHDPDVTDKRGCGRARARRTYAM